MNGHKILGLGLGVSLLLGFGTSAGAIPMAASTSAVTSKSHVVILAGSEERGARQSGRPRIVAAVSGRRKSLQSAAGPLARFSLERSRSSDRKSRQNKMPERIQIA